MKEISVILLILLAFPIAFSQDYTNITCLGNDTLQRNSTYSFFTSYGNMKNLTISKNVYCNFGCDSGLCNTEPFYIMITIIALFISLIGVAIYLIKHS